MLFNDQNCEEPSACDNDASERYAGTEALDVSTEVPRTLDKGMWLLNRNSKTTDAFHEPNNIFILGQLDSWLGP
jgi:hypothetical protein